MNLNKKQLLKDFTTLILRQDVFQKYFKTIFDSLYDDDMVRAHISHSDYQMPIYRAIIDNDLAQFKTELSQFAIEPVHTLYALVIAYDRSEMLELLMRQGIPIDVPLDGSVFTQDTKSMPQTIHMLNYVKKLVLDGRQECPSVLIEQETNIVLCSSERYSCDALPEGFKDRAKSLVCESIKSYINEKIALMINQDTSRTFQKDNCSIQDADERLEAPKEVMSVKDSEKQQDRTFFQTFCHLIFNNLNFSAVNGHIKILGRQITQAVKRIAHQAAKTPVLGAIIGFFKYLYQLFSKKYGSWCGYKKENNTGPQINGLNRQSLDPSRESAPVAVGNNAVPGNHF